MKRELSLANKCLLAFGGAVVVIVLAALAVPWFRMNTLVDEGQLEMSRQQARTWQRLDREAGPASTDAPVDHGGIIARRLNQTQARIAAAKDEFVQYALKELESKPTLAEVQDARWVRTSREYRYAAAERGKLNSLDSILILERRSIEATKLLLVNTGFLMSAGGTVLLLSLLAFYLLTHKVILSPVRSLRETAERVREGNLAIRSDIKTGDEFEELADTFNQMLTDLQSKQDQLRGINAALDVKLNELASSNSSLHQASKLKSEFLANISHELRTPLNSIIGFAELLLEFARADASLAEPPANVAKRLRYGENIVAAGRNLLGMINSLLDMAKIEAGKVELDISRVNPRDICDALIGLAHPLADKKGIQLTLDAHDDLPLIRTDAKKLHQVLFNFLSNAVKFTEPHEKTGRTPQVTLRAERIVGGRGGTADALTDDRLRFSVIDNGPGIAPEEQSRIFEKFHQIDSGHTREHAGTGLGLAISKELAHMLKGEILLVSEPGRGSMFSLSLPLAVDAAPAETEPASRSLAAAKA